MSEFPTAADVAVDVALVEQMLERIATPDEAAAARRVLGVDRQTELLSRAYAPAPPPPSLAVGGVDLLVVAYDARARYAEWVASFPDDDPTPLHARERALRLAEASVVRLERVSDDSG